MRRIRCKGRSSVMEREQAIAEAAAEAARQEVLMEAHKDMLTLSRKHRKEMAQMMEEHRAEQDRMSNRINELRKQLEHAQHLLADVDRYRVKPIVIPAPWNGEVEEVKDPTRHPEWTYDLRNRTMYRTSDNSA